jgi:hypothetical protein
MVSCRRAFALLGLPGGTHSPHQPTQSGGFFRTAQSIFVCGVLTLAAVFSVPETLLADEGGVKPHIGAKNG